MSGKSAPVVMIVEDSEDARDLFVLALESAGFVAHGAGTIGEAREMLGKVHPDALIADYALPDGTGVELVALCADARPKVCVLLTGFDAHAVESTGFDVVLTKPVRPDALIETLRSRLSAT